MHGFHICLAVYGHTFDAHLTGSAHHTTCYLSTVGYQDFLNLHICKQGLQAYTHLGDISMHLYINLQFLPLLKVIRANSKCFHVSSIHREADF